MLHLDFRDYSGMDQSYARGGIRVCDTGGVYSGDSESGGAVVASGLCDACPGCDDVCDSKCMPNPFLSISLH